MTNFLQAATELLSVIKLLFSIFYLGIKESITTVKTLFSILYSGVTGCINAIKTLFITLYSESITAVKTLFSILYSGVTGCINVVKTPFLILYSGVKWFITTINLLFLMLYSGVKGFITAVKLLFVKSYLLIKGCATAAKILLVKLYFGTIFVTKFLLWIVVILLIFFIIINIIYFFIEDEDSSNSSTDLNINELLTNLVGQKDRVSNDILQPGEEVYVCQPCQLGYHQDSWEFINKKCEQCDSSINKLYSLPIDTTIDNDDNDFLSSQNQNELLTNLVGQKDRVSGEILKAGEKVYICEPCQLGYHQDSWEFLNKKCEQCESEIYKLYTL